jgi:hypothetical protein
MKLNKKNARRRHHPSKDNNTVKHLDNNSSNSICDNNTIIVYDSNQEQQQQIINNKTLGGLTTIFKQFILTSVSLNVIARLIYYYIIKSEAEKLFEDIKRVKKRFASNTYSRISNELNIFILNSIEINSAHEDSPHCFLAGSTKYLLSQQSSSSLISELISDVFDMDYEYFNLDFFSQVYIHSLKQTISLGESLDTLKKFVIPYKDLIYDPHEKNNLRGAHSQLQELRSVYNQKMNSQYTFYVGGNTEEQGNNSREALQKFTEKLQKLITNPDLMMCNHISSQNSINIKNFKQNFINVNQIAIKDLYNNVLDTTDGLISMRIQNSISKSCYLLCFLVLGFVLGGLFRKIFKKYI